MFSVLRWREQSARRPRGPLRPARASPSRCDLATQGKEGRGRRKEREREGREREERERERGDHTYEGKTCRAYSTGKRFAPHAL